MKLLGIFLIYCRQFLRFNYFLNKIVRSGDYEPTDDECCLPENAATADEKQRATKLAEMTTEEKTLGIPDFWINVLKFNPMFESEITDRDELVLKV